MPDCDMLCSIDIMQLPPGRSWLPSLCSAPRSWRKYNARISDALIVYNHAASSATLHRNLPSEPMWVTIGRALALSGPSANPCITSGTILQIVREEAVNYEPADEEMGSVHCSVVNHVIILRSRLSEFKLRAD